MTALMTPLLILAYCGLGFLLWRGILRLGRLYEERVPENFQDCLYKVGKHLPEIVIDLVISLCFWSGLGAVLLGVLLYPLGVAVLSAHSRFGLAVVVFVLMLLVVHFWSTPERIKNRPSRGRKLQERPDAPPAPPKCVPQAKRGRTIRSYRDVK